MRRRRTTAVAVAVLAAALLAGVFAVYATNRSAEQLAAPSENHGGTPSWTPPATVPAVLGVNYHPLWQGADPDRRARVLDELAAARVPWVRIDIGWHDIQPDGPSTYDDRGVQGIDQRIAEARQRGLRVLLLFYWAPAWASGTEAKNGRPRDPSQYAAAAAWVAERYDGRLGADLTVDALELWNEPDLDRFWAAEPAASRITDFATLVRLAGAAVKRANPGMTVVAGGLSLLDVGWLEAFYAADPGTGSSYDALGLHAYPSPSDSPPDHLDADRPQYSMLTLGAMSRAMDARGDPASIWVTEFGWSTHADPPFTKAWERGVTPERQADYLLAAMPVLTAEPRVAAAFWYDAWSPPTDDVHLGGFGLLGPDFERRPAYFALRCATERVCSRG